MKGFDGIVMKLPLSPEQEWLWDQMGREERMLVSLEADYDRPAGADDKFDQDRMRDYNRLAQNVTRARLSALRGDLLRSGDNVSVVKP